jgi:hypothetical protein
MTSAPCSTSFGKTVPRVLAMLAAGSVGACRMTATGVAEHPATNIVIPANQADVIPAKAGIQTARRPPGSLRAQG